MRLGTFIMCITLQIVGITLLYICGVSLADKFKEKEI